MGWEGSSEEMERSENNYCLGYLRTFFFFSQKNGGYRLEKYIKNVNYLMLNVL